jgi:hypothetical protein
MISERFARVLFVSEIFEGPYSTIPKKNKRKNFLVFTLKGNPS